MRIIPDRMKEKDNGIPTNGEPNLIALISMNPTRLDYSLSVCIDGTHIRCTRMILSGVFLRIIYLILSRIFLIIGVLYSSGPFALNAGRTERFSLALLMGDNFDDLVRNKEIVQGIFNANYRFAKPPEKPTVKAIAENGRVILTWDNIAEFPATRFLA